MVVWPNCDSQARQPWKLASNSFDLGEEHGSKDELLVRRGVKVTRQPWKLVTNSFDEYVKV